MTVSCEETVLTMISNRGYCLWCCNGEHMRPAFSDFEWPVAPAYRWQDWLDGEGQPVTPSSRLLAQLERDVAAAPSRFERIKSTDDGARLAREYARIGAQRAELSVKGGPVLMPVDPANSNRYRPMGREHAALFRVFADIDYRDPKAILAFASRHGDLGLVHDRRTAPVRNVAGRLLRWQTSNGESHLAWAIEICYMREALRLSGTRSVDGLRRLKWLSDRHLPYVRAGLTFTPAQRPELAIEPLALISALWLQFALAITGDKAFSECKFCKKVFEISTEQTGFRRHREFCTASCKTMDYRRRKRTALGLAESGEELRSIATKTDTAVDTVRGWLASTGDRRPRKNGDA